MKASVPEVCEKEILRKQFNWLLDGQISTIINKNLGPELLNMETFLR